MKSKWINLKWWWINNETKDLIYWKLLELFVCPFKGHTNDIWHDLECARCMKPDVWQYEVDNG